MPIFLNILFLIIGMALLIKGADFFVGGASEVAELLGKAETLRRLDLAMAMLNK